MRFTFQRSSLVAQVADAIRSKILHHAWQEWIPSERELSQTLHVSRNTCRNALRTLRHEGLIEPVVGRGNRVDRASVHRVRSESAHLRSVGIVVPEAINRLRPQLSLTIAELRNELFDWNISVVVHDNAAPYQARPEQALEKLVEKNHHDCWVLFLSGEPLQRWFMARGLPTLVSGSLYPEIKLPSIDLDNRAICRHAAGKLIALGHRRLIFFNRRRRSAGDLESEAGFAEGARASSHLDVDARIVYHNDDRESVIGLIQKQFASPRPPTGVVVAHSYCYLSVVTALARRGFAIPGDVSLISRDDDAFLSYVDPEPARYVADPGTFARKTMSLLRPLLEGGSAKLEPVRVLPRFVNGGSWQPVGTG